MLFLFLCLCVVGSVYDLNSLSTEPLSRSHSRIELIALFSKVLQKSPLLTKILFLSVFFLGCIHLLFLTVNSPLSADTLMNVPTGYIGGIGNCGLVRSGDVDRFDLSLSNAGIPLLVVPTVLQQQNKLPEVRFLLGVLLGFY